MLNPFRYRGYYYDEETGFYYLINRYYDPETGRFLSADHVGYMAEQIDTLNGCNLFVYCLNNPVMYSDPEGTAAWWEWLIGAAVVVLVAAATVVTAGAAAVALGASTAAVGATMAGAAIGAGVAGGVNLVTQGATQEHINFGSLVFDSAVGGITGALSGISGALVGAGRTAAGKLAQKGAQIAVNLFLSTATYTTSNALSGKETTMSGLALAGLNGIASGALFNRTLISTLSSIAFEALSYFDQWKSYLFNV